MSELLCTQSAPSMPIYFWNDPDNIKYRQAYFDIYPGVWQHGDYIEITESGKKVELAVRNVIHGGEVKNKDALANPAALDNYLDLPELES